MFELFFISDFDVLFKLEWNYALGIYIYITKIIENEITINEIKLIFIYDKMKVYKYK